MVAQWRRRTRDSRLMLLYAHRSSRGSLPNGEGKSERSDRAELPPSDKRAETTSRCMPRCSNSSPDHHNTPLVPIPRTATRRPQSPNALQRRITTHMQIPAMLPTPMMRRTQRIAVVVMITPAARAIVPVMPLDAPRCTSRRLAAMP